ncbi:MAG TPA: acylphosphatase [Casimicrobiaceae bacterium]|nr:acylphosphatase [Casimicrobiaceae bacterium]
MIARRLVVRGRVQGVGFRYALVDVATMMGAAGWVRNRRDGTVEALVQGEDTIVDAVVAWCRRGPPAARVTTVDVEPATPDSGTAGFSMKPTS